MTTAASARTIVATTTPGWFIDAADPDGGRVRKAKDGSDRIITLEQYEDAKARAAALGDPDMLGDILAADAAGPDPAAKADEAQERNAEHRKAAAAAQNGAKPDLGVLTSGKPIKGKVTTIRCAWVDPDARTKKQQKIFESGFAGVKPGESYDAVAKAAGDDEGAAPDGREVVIHVQDLFQVRFHPDNQRKHRNELRRRQGAKKAARRAQDAK